MLSGGGIMNDAYLDPKAGEVLRIMFQEDALVPSVQLQKFLSDEEFKKVSDTIKKEWFKKEIVPASHSFGRAEVSSIVLKILFSDETKKVIERIIGRKIKNVLEEAFSFEQGDYTIIHDEKNDEGTYFIFSINDDWEYSNGGSTIVVDGTGEFRNISAPGNTLTIVDIKKDVHLFHKYVNHHAETRKLYVVKGRIED